MVLVKNTIILRKQKPLTQEKSSIIRSLSITRLLPSTLQVKPHSFRATSLSKRKRRLTKLQRREPTSMPSTNPLMSQMC